MAAAVDSARRGVFPMASGIVAESAGRPPGATANDVAALGQYHARRFESAPAACQLGRSIGLIIRPGNGRDGPPPELEGVQSRPPVAHDQCTA